jgi:hypothetical protein
MTNEQMQERVKALSQGNHHVEVWIWDKAPFNARQIVAAAVPSQLPQLSESEEVLGAIYYTGDEEPGCEEFTTDPKGLEELQGIFGKVVERQARLRENYKEPKK